MLEPNQYVLGGSKFIAQMHKQNSKFQSSSFCRNGERSCTSKGYDSVTAAYYQRQGEGSDSGDTESKPAQMVANKNLVGKVLHTWWSLIIRLATLVQ